jgi:hypothetical protein
MIQDTTPQMLQDTTRLIQDTTPQMLQDTTRGPNVSGSSYSIELRFHALKNAALRHFTW